jgi:uncharacterized repeat protein (TIGR01451 family)
MIRWKSRFAVLATMAALLVFAMVAPAAAANLSSDIEVVGSGPFHVGDTITFKMTAVSSAAFPEVAVTAWTITIAGGAPISFSVPNIAPGGSATRTQSYTVTEAAAKAGDGKIEAKFFCETTEMIPEEGPFGAVAANTTSDIAIVESGASFTVDKTVNFDADPGYGKEETNKIGSPAHWRITFSNTGESTLYDISVVDSGKTFTLASLAAGASETWNYDEANIQADKVNEATAGAKDFFGKALAPKKSSAKVTVFQAANLDLAITKTADKTNPAPGEVVKYTLKYRNLGETPAKDYKIVDTFDKAHVTVVDAGGGAISNGTITWFFSGPLSLADGEKSIFYSTRINKVMPVGKTNVDNTVVISDPSGLDGNLANNKATERVVVNESEEFLPYTGTDANILLGAAAIAAMGGLSVRRLARRGR